MRVNLPFLNSSFICLEEKEDDIFFFFVKVDRTVTALISSYPNKVAEASRAGTTITMRTLRPIYLPPRKNSSSSSSCFRAMNHQRPQKTTNKCQIREQENARRVLRVVKISSYFSNR